MQERLRRALDDPSRWVDDEDAAKARYLLCAHVLERVGLAARRCRQPVLAVKGAGLAHTVYPKPWLREMSDVDLIVHPDEHDVLVQALEQHGCARMPPPAGRRFSARLLGETVLVLGTGATSWTIEVHTGLDKIVARPVPYDHIRQRSIAPAGLDGLRVPSLEDHALLVALHASASVKPHPIALLDLELLLRAGVERRVMVGRATRWRLRTALYLSLTALRDAGSRSVPTEILQEVQPGRFRSRLATLPAACGHGGSVASVPEPAVVRRRSPNGLAWMARQAAVRDDSWLWVVGVGRYAVLRLAERAPGLRDRHALPERLGRARGRR